MQQCFYASGFLYHPATQQILLQQQKTTSKALPLWSLFGGICLRNKSAEATFQKVVQKLLGVKLSLAAIYPVYFYSSKGVYKNHQIVYAEAKELKEFPPRKGHAFAWFTFKQIPKLPLAEQTKHDIIVGQRVVDSHTRKRLGQRTIE